MKYQITMTVEGKFTCEVDAKNLEEAKEKAEYEFSEADFGELFDIEAETTNAEDEDGNFYRYD